MVTSSSPPDPPPPTATTTPTPTATAAATTRLFTNPPRDPRPPTPPLPQQTQPNYQHSTPYPPPSQQQQQQPPPLYTAQSLPTLAPRVPSNTIHHQLGKSRDHPPHGILYPVASSGRGFLPKAIRPKLADQTVTVANPGGFPPRSAVAAAYPQPVRPYGFPHSDPQGQNVHLIRPAHLQHTIIGSSGGAVRGMVNGVPVSAHPKVSPSLPSVSDCNGYKDVRDRSRDDTFATVRDRKVRISDGSSLYALCRSWLRNGYTDESQPQYVDGVKSLPRPLPIPVADANSPTTKESDKDDEEEEEEGSVEHLSPQDLLQRHVKRAKRVRARLREERLQRIARYKTRLALLLPPVVEQHFRNDMSAGN